MHSYILETMVRKDFFNEQQNAESFVVVAHSDLNLQSNPSLPLFKSFPSPSLPQLFLLQNKPQ